jgi:hypothetical protein
MTKKQTAIESLIKRCNDSLDKEPDEPTQQEIGYSKALVHFIILLEEAKEMEKEQIIKAYANGVVNEISIYSTITGEEYYNETYGKI